MTIRDAGHALTIVAVACAASVPAPVHADRGGQGRDVGLFVLGGALAVNTGFTIYDLATLGDGKPAIYGFAETVLTVPQAALFGTLALTVDEADGAWIPAALALWTAGLAAHGIYTLAADDPAPVERVVVLSFGGRF